MANNVKKIREKRGMTQEQLSERAGVSRITISQLENGANDVRLGTLKRIAEALECSVTDFF